MKPSIRIACEAAGARQSVVVWIDEHGQFTVASYAALISLSKAATAERDAAR